MIKVANSALLGRNVKVETVSQAVTRIGLTQIKSISTAMALKQVFVSENKVVAVAMQKSWHKTMDIASVAT
jgi:HD-like signal output (HDOD) protein